MKQEEGRMIIHIVPYSLAETKLKSEDVNRVLKERFNMKAIFYSWDYRNNMNDYLLLFDTRDNALKAGNYLNDILSCEKQVLL